MALLALAFFPWDLCRGNPVLFRQRSGSCSALVRLSLLYVDKVFPHVPSAALSHGSAWAKHCPPQPGDSRTKSQSSGSSRSHPRCDPFEPKLGAHPTAHLTLPLTASRQGERVRAEKEAAEAGRSAADIAGMVEKRRRLEKLLKRRSSDTTRHALEAAAACVSGGDHARACEILQEALESI